MIWVIVVLLVIAGGGALFAESGSSAGGSIAAQPTQDTMSSDDSLDVFDFSGGSMKLSAADIAQVAANAGFSGNDLTTAVAVALAESGGNPSAYNPETAAGTPQGQGSYGLWQIYLKAHPEFSGVDLTDPNNNANAAFSVYSAAGSSFRPWSTFNNGAYQAHLVDAEGATAA